MPNHIVCNNTSNNTKVNSPGVFDHIEDHTRSGVINYFKSPRRSFRIKKKNESMNNKNMPDLGVQSSVIPPVADKIAVSRSNKKTLRPGAVPSLFLHNDIINTPNIQPVTLSAAVKRAISRSNKEILRLAAGPFLHNDIRSTPNIQVAILPVAVKKAISSSNKKTLRPGAVPSLFLHNDIINTTNNQSTSYPVNRWVFNSNEISSSNSVANVESIKNPILNENIHNDIINTTNNQSTSYPVNRWVFNSNEISSSNSVANVESIKNPILN